MSTLDWMPVSKSYDENDGALMPGLAVKHGEVARIGHGQVFMEIWPSEPPDHLEDLVTLTLTVDGDVVDEIGRYAFHEEAMPAAQVYVDEQGEELRGSD